MSLVSSLHEREREVGEAIEQVDRELEPLLRRKEDLQAELAAIQNLRAFHREEAASGNGAIALRREWPHVQYSYVRRLLDAVVDLLAERGSPMDINAIRAALRERGVPIPGQGENNNIIVHLRRFPAVFSFGPHWGEYGLKEWETGTKANRG